MKWLLRDPKKTLWKRALSHLEIYRGLESIDAILAPDADIPLVGALRAYFPQARIERTPEGPQVRYNLIVRESKPTEIPYENLLCKNGFLLIESTHLSAHFPVLASWKDGAHSFSLFQKSDAATEEFVPKDDWPQANPLAAMPRWLQPAFIGTRPQGLYWRFWPATFELYRGDDEPHIEPLAPSLRAPFRIVTWQRFSRGDTPQGWRTFSERPYYKIGFVPLSEEYEKEWSENARRLRRLWHTKYAGTVYTIEKVSLEEFAPAYLKSPLPFFMKRDIIAQLTQRIHHNEPVSLWAVRRKENGLIVAGIAILHSPLAKSSYYIAGFYLKSAGHDPVMPGLFDHWFKESLARGDRYIDFGNFWKKGDPSSWKGFSTFKAKFGPSYFFYRPLLFKFPRT